MSEQQATPRAKGWTVQIPAQPEGEPRDFNPEDPLWAVVDSIEETVHVLEMASEHIAGHSPDTPERRLLDRSIDCQRTLLIDDAAQLRLWFGKAKWKAVSSGSGDN